MARKFLYFVAFCIILVIGGAFALALFPGPLTRLATVPSVEFAPLEPLEANAYAQNVARKLAAKPMSALLQTKQLMKKGQTALVLAQMAEEGQHFGRMLGEPAAREAFSAFMAKRKPDFSKL